MKKSLSMRTEPANQGAGSWSINKGKYKAFVTCPGPGGWLQQYGAAALAAVNKSLAAE